ncbi:MAG: SH3 domain-containing protein [Myxococcales bacterium]|nr:SH3 domain-containing protein [Myxococcales bacterium]
MIPLLLISALLAAELPKLRYTVKGEEATREVIDYEFTTWEQGAQAFVVTDEANLRSAADPASAVVCSLPMGSPVRIDAVAGEEVKVQDRIDRWYRVKATAPDGRAATGFLFGNVLTPYRFEEDFDGDGELEIATVGFTADFKIRTRFLEPKAPAGKRVASVDAQPSGGGFLGVTGGQVAASVVEARTAGVALIKLESYFEACGDYSDTYVSYFVPGTSPGTLGKAQVALRTSGMADPPAIATPELHFNPAKRTARLDLKIEGEADDGKPTAEVETTHYALENGVFKPRPKVRPRGTARQVP